MCMSMCVYVWVQVPTDSKRGLSDPLALEFASGCEQPDTDTENWELKTQVFWRVADAPNCWAISPALGELLIGENKHWSISEWQKA